MGILSHEVTIMFTLSFTSVVLVAVGALALVVGMIAYFAWEL